jgi:hypothetical protein
MFLKNKLLIIALNLYHPFVAAESTTWIFFIFWRSKIHVSSTGIVSSLSPPVDINMSLCHVPLPSRGAKMSSLPPLHLPTTLYPVAGHHPRTI